MKEDRRDCFNVSVIHSGYPWPYFRSSLGGHGVVAIGFDCVDVDAEEMLGLWSDCLGDFGFCSFTFVGLGRNNTLLRGDETHEWF